MGYLSCLRSHHLENGTNFPLTKRGRVVLVLKELSNSCSDMLGNAGMVIGFKQIEDIHQIWQD